MGKYIYGKYLFFIFSAIEKESNKCDEKFKKYVIVIYNKK